MIILGVRKLLIDLLGCRGYAAVGVGFGGSSKLLVQAGILCLP